MKLSSITDRLLLLTSVLVFVLSAKPATLGAQGAGEPLSLAEAIAWGVENNLGVAGERLNVEVAMRNDNWVSAGRAPVVQANLGVNNNLNSQNNPASFINGSFFQGNASAGLTFNYTLFNGYRVRFVKQQLRENVRLARLGMFQLIEASIFDITSAYYLAQLNKAQVALNEQIYALNRDRVAFQEVRKAYGQGQSIDLLQAKTALLSDSIAVEQSRLVYDNALRALYQVLDTKPEAFAGRDISDTLAFTEREWDFGAIETRIDSTGGIRFFNIQKNLASYNSDIARSAMKPSISINAGLNFTENAFRRGGEDPMTGENFDLIFGNNSGASFGVQAAYTLWDAGARKRNIDNAVVQERIAQLNYRKAKEDARTQMLSMLATYRNQGKLLELQDLLIQNAEANLKLSEEQLRAGAINSFDYRTVQLEYLNAKQNRLQTVYNLLLSDLNLRRMSATLLK